jgi:hypothetical protein
MYSILVRAAAPLALVLALGGVASAQSSPFSVTPESLAATAQGNAGRGARPARPAARNATVAAQPTTVTDDEGDWQFTVYPVLVWVPMNLEIEVKGPFDGMDGGNGGGGGGGIGDGIQIVDGRFDGAFLAGFTATNGAWRFDFDGVYAAVGGDRTTPSLTVDLNLIYFNTAVSRELAGGFYVTGGLRRLALKYDIDFLDFPTYTNKPGIWDPMVGVAYHKTSRVLEFHAHTEYGGFGVGSDHDFGFGARFDFKPFKHVGLTAGYNLVILKFSKGEGAREFTAKQTIGGPVAGIGLYF